MRLFDLIEQYDLVGPAADLLGQGAAIVGILPLPVAVLAWCNAVLPTDKKHSIVLVAGETGVVVGIIKDRRLTNLLKVQTIEDALANVRRNADAFALEDPAMYLWYSKPALLRGEPWFD